MQERTLSLGQEEYTERNVCGFMDERGERGKETGKTRESVCVCVCLCSEWAFLLL